MSHGCCASNLREKALSALHSRSLNLTQARKPCSEIHQEPQHVLPAGRGAGGGGGHCAAGMCGWLRLRHLENAQEAVICLE